MASTDRATGDRATNDLDVTVVVPVYNGARTLEPLTRELAAALDGRGWSWELVFVCDRPVDDSWQVVRQLAAAFPTVRGVLLRRNYGQHPATLCGVRLARGRTVVTMDEDLQHAPADVPRLVEASQAGTALVYGVSEELHHGGFRNFSSRLIKRVLARYLSVEHGRTLSAFRAFPAEAREAFAHYQAAMVAIDVLLSWSAMPVQAVPCRHAPRQAGHSGYSFRKLVRLLGDLAFGFSVAPLRLATWAGALALVLAIAIALYVLVNWLRYGSAVPGFAFLSLAITTLGGAQLLSLGLIGEYLGRLYVQALGRPQYTVAQRIGGTTPTTVAAPPAQDCSRFEVT